MSDQLRAPAASTAGQRHCRQYDSRRDRSVLANLSSCVKSDPTFFPVLIMGGGFPPRMFDARELCSRCTEETSGLRQIAADFPGSDGDRQPCAQYARLALSDRRTAAISRPHGATWTPGPGRAMLRGARGETGRRDRLKICSPATGMPVRIRPGAYPPGARAPGSEKTMARAAFPPVFSPAEARKPDIRRRNRHRERF